MKFKMVVKKGLEEVAVVNGQVEIDADHFTVADAHKILDTEKFLERMFGLRFHLNQAGEWNIDALNPWAVNPKLGGK
jgi:hypothetical protein